MTDIVTDPELLKLLNEGEVVTDADLLKQLNAEETTPTESAGALGMAAPAVAGYGFAQPTGLGQVARDAASVTGQGLKYLANRGGWTNISDLAGIMHTGMPLASMARGTFKAATQDPAQTIDVLRRAAEVARAAPGYAANVAGGLARGAARVAGPAGLAYDIYEAYPYYEQANVPQRLQSGEIPRQMQAARRMMLNAPTPAPLTRQEAQNLLASGDQRTIDIYRNDAEVANLIRRKAAQKVLGQQ